MGYTLGKIILEENSNTTHPRRKAREATMQALYALEINNGFPQDVLQLCDDSFNNSDNEGAFWQNWDVPNVSQIGRTACNYRSDKDRIDCNSRWGTGANDIETTLIPRM